MAHTERRSLRVDKDPFLERDGRVYEKRLPEREVSHSRPCWLCGTGKIAKRKNRSKPRRQEAKRIISLGDEHWGEPVY